MAIAALLLSGCSQTSAQQPRMPGPADVVATVGSTAITLGQVDEKALQQAASTFGAMKLSQALYEARRTVIDQMVDDELIAQDAKARKLEPAAVIQQEITAKVAAVTDDDIAAWFKDNQGRLQGATIDQVRTAIRGYLVQQRTLDARRTFVDHLRSKATLHISLDPPRMVIAKADRPTKGPATAPVEMIEFSDFQCPFCERAFPTLTKVLNDYGDKIHFVYRHFPSERPSAGAPCGRGRRLRGRTGQVLAVPRSTVRRPVEARRRGPQAERGGAGHGRRAIQRVRRFTQVQGRGRCRHSRGRGFERRRARRRSRPSRRSPTRSRRRRSP